MGFDWVIEDFLRLRSPEGRSSWEGRPPQVEGFDEGGETAAGDRSCGLQSRGPY